MSLLIVYIGSKVALHDIFTLPTLPTTQLVILHRNSTRFPRIPVVSFQICILTLLAPSFLLPSCRPARVHHCSQALTGKSIQYHHYVRPNAMDQDRAANRTEAFENTPSLSQTASNTNPATWHSADDVYSGRAGRSNSLQQPDTISTTHSASRSSVPPAFETLPVYPYSQNQPAFWPTNVFELAANEAMSRQQSYGGNQPPIQYQLLSSESPADQARSLSQVSPGFIFVMFPLSCVLPCPSILHPSAFMSLFS